MTAGFLAGVAAVDFDISPGMVFVICVVLVCGILILSAGLEPSQK